MMGGKRSYPLGPDTDYREFREFSKGDIFISTVDPNQEINLKFWEEKAKEMLINKGRKL